jgi:signal transduction histidine kinase
MQKPGKTIDQLQQQISLLEEQLGHAQKMTALGELVSTTTHEFNNVLMTILNYAKMGTRHRDDATRDKAFEKILNAAQRANKITNSILGFARNRKPGLEPTDMTKIVEDTLTLLERELQKYRVCVEAHIEPVPTIMANGNQLQQVLLNLLVNARQAMPGGGRILLRLAHDAANNTVEVAVRDTGSGIPADKLPRIFDRYFSTKSGPDESGKGGTGLGLAFCHDVIEEHAGRIRVESTVGKGTCFTLKFPVSKPAAAVEFPNPVARPPAAVPSAIFPAAGLPPAIGARSHGNH